MRNTFPLPTFVQFEGAMELLEESAVEKDLTRGTASEAIAAATVPDIDTGRPAPAMESAKVEGAAVEELDMTLAEAAAAAAAAKLVQARTPVGTEGGEEAREDVADDGKDDGKRGDEEDSGGVMYAPAPTRLPTPP